MHCFGLGFRVCVVSVGAFGRRMGLCVCLRVSVDARFGLGLLCFGFLRGVQIFFLCFG